MASYCQDLFSRDLAKSLVVKAFSARTATRVAYYFGTSRTIEPALALGPFPRNRFASLTFLAICVLACTSCTRQVQTASVPAPVPAVRTVMVRQAKNAAEAGEG